MGVQIWQSSDEEWDAYVHQHKQATFFHQMAYRRVVENSFGHTPYYLVAREDGRIVGVLPVFLVKSLFFGAFLVSLPFCDYGGILAHNEQARDSLLEKAVEIGREVGVDCIELRHRHPNGLDLPQQLEKVNLRLPLPADAEEMWLALDGKVRNQVRKAEKSGLEFEVGSLETLDGFYDVFATRMRALGTPVYTRAFFQNLLTGFPHQAEVLLVTLDGEPIGGGIAVYFKDAMEVPWASSRNEYFSLCPNNLLYWGAIRRAYDRGCRHFDFGRSSKGSGNYRFKRQWGAEDEQLYYQFVLVGGGEMPNLDPSSAKYAWATKVWSKLPLVLTNRLGPYISRYIP